MKARMKAIVATLLVLAAWLASGVVRAQDGVSPESRAGQALMAQPVGDDPAQAFGWIEVVDRWFPRLGRAARVERGLMDMYLRQAAGEPWTRDATLESMHHLGEQLPSALAAAAPRRLASMEARFPDCESRNTCARPNTSHAFAPKPQATGHRASPSQTRYRALMAAAAIAALMGFFASARWLGERVTVWATAALLLCGWVWYFGARYDAYGAGVAVFVPAGFFVSAFGLLLVWFAYRLYASFFFAPRSAAR